MFDENLPARLSFSPSLPVTSVLELGSGASDSDVWNYARRARLAIVTKDADFSGRMTLNSPPPWVVHLRFGNIRRREFHALLKDIWPQVEQLLETHKLVNIHSDRVEGIC